MPRTELALDRRRALAEQLRLAPVYLFVIALAILYAGPFVWVISTSLKSLQDTFEMPPRLLPREFRPQNYVEVFERIPLVRYTLNTALLSVSTLVGILFSGPLAAYSVSKIQWRGRRLLFALIMSTLLLPFQVTMIPLYVTFKNLGWIGTYLPLIVPAFLGGGLGGGYYIFLLRQFFMGIPDSLMESARIDGASESRIYVSIALPLSVPVLVTVGVFAFLNTWSDFLGPLIYLTRSNMYTLSLGLQAFLAEHHVEWNLLMAASVLFSIPTLILFFFAQRQFIEGVKTSGMKF